MKSILYALLLLIIFYPSWAVACQACMEGPLKDIAVPCKMMIGAIVWITASGVAKGIWNAIYLD